LANRTDFFGRREGVPKGESYDEVLSRGVGGVAVVDKLEFVGDEQSELEDDEDEAKHDFLGVEGGI